LHPLADTKVRVSVETVLRVWKPMKPSLDWLEMWRIRSLYQARELELVFSNVADHFAVRIARMRQVEINSEGPSLGESAETL
ncbi:MAG: hypothetical protein WA869_05725, partial [Alloacidobacterium sp.]